MQFYNKLIRDKIPQIIKANGKKANVRVLDDEEYKKMLDVKLQEELDEYTAAANDEDQVEELADLVELVYAILESKGVSIEDFERIRLEKQAIRGGFKEKLFLVNVCCSYEGDDLNETEEKAKLLVKHIRLLRDFKIESEIDGNYDHMGATIVDAVLQAGLTYETVVKPRVLRILNEFPYAKTTSAFLSLIERHPVEVLLQNKNGESFKGDKPQRIKEIALMLQNESVETESDLKLWLQSNDNISKLKEMKGIKDKTVDYFKILVGFETNAVDRHLVNFLKEAGIVASSYNEYQEIINKAADMLRVNKANFDHSIWTYMSER